MENKTNLVPKRLDQVFLTEITKNESKVRFNESYTNQTTEYYQNIPIMHEKYTLHVVQTECGKLEECKSIEMDSVNRLIDQERQCFKSDSFKSHRSQRDKITNPSMSKFFRISLTEEMNQDTIEKGKIKKQKQTKPQEVKKKSTLRAFADRTNKQERIDNNESNEQLAKQKQEVKREVKRRKCKITTQKQFQLQCSKYIEAKQKEQTKELFRKVNREMKSEAIKNQEDNYFQRIRKQCKKKLQFIGENQKFYNEVQIKRLSSIVNNCESLIHRRQSKFSTPYRKLKSQGSPKRPTKNQRMNYTDRQNGLNYPNQTSIGSIDQKTATTHDLIERSKSKRPISAKVLNKNIKTAISKRLSNIVNDCGQEIQMLKQVKSDMKIFKFYCQKINFGFSRREVKLQKYFTDLTDN